MEKIRILNHSITSLFDAPGTEALALRNYDFVLLGVNSSKRPRAKYLDRSDRQQQCNRRFATSLARGPPNNNGGLGGFRSTKRLSTAQASSLAPPGEKQASSHRRHPA